LEYKRFFGVGPILKNHDLKKSGYFLSNSAIPGTRTKLSELGACSGISKSFPVIVVILILTR